MYVRSIECENLGPIERMNVSPSLNLDRTPRPVVFVGQNGAGKSLILASIVDAIIEARKKTWASIAEVAHEKFFRLIKQSYIKRGAPYSFLKVRLGETDPTLQLIELASALKCDDFAAKYPNLLQQCPDHHQHQFNISGLYKNSTSNGAIADAVKKQVYLYFPYFRYERPAWLNVEDAKIDFAESTSMFGFETNSIIRTNVLTELQRWLLNLALDRELYEKKIAPLRLNQTVTINAFFGYEGNNHRTLELVNQILTTMYKARDPSIEHARIGIAPKVTRQISIHVKWSHSDKELVVTPSFSQLSSGELMTLAIFGEIIRAFDHAHRRPPSDLKEITGVVLIDEVDLHLHISFQKSVLPKIIQMFPGVQFIVSTHSPFFVLGLSESTKGNLDIFDLPISNRITPEQFSEFQAGYDIYFAKNEQFRMGFENLTQQVAASTRPIVITEGKTDWKHLKSALASLLEGGYATLDIEFLEFGDDVDMGDERLADMCEHFARVKQPRKMLFVFDRDNPKIIGRMGGGAVGYRDLGNNVFSLCIPQPSHRAGYRNVSIEFYYSDAQVTTIDPSTGRRLFFSNEVEKIVSPTTNKMSYRIVSPPVAGEELEKKVFDKECDKICDQAGNPVAMSKSAFADLVAAGNPPFEGFGRQEFQAIFEVVRTIVALPGK